MNENRQSQSEPSGLELFDVTISNSTADGTIQRRRELVFLLLGGSFLSFMTMLNLLGITKFLELGYLTLAVGVLPYPLTFLCTDLVSELYGKRRANQLVLAGLFANLLVLLFVWLGNVIPGIQGGLPEHDITFVVAEKTAETNGMDPGEIDIVGIPGIATVTFAPEIQGLIQAQLDAGATDVTLSLQHEQLYARIAKLARMAVIGSMIAYVVAQFLDVWLFHAIKRLTSGGYPWLRNNASTLISQLIDSTIVVLATFYEPIWNGTMEAKNVGSLILGSYAFKAAFAAIDTLPFHFGAKYLGEYLQIDPRTTKM